MNESGWAERIAADREHVAAMQAEFAAGVDEVESARRHGFATRADLNADLLAWGVQVTRDGSATVAAS
jgi:hypothetical protein